MTRLQKLLKRQRRSRYLLRHRRISDRGFTLPIALGLGLLMLLIGVTMVARSNTDQSTASGQKQAAQSLAAAEGGVNRVLSILNYPDNAYLLGHPTVTPFGYDPINPTTNKTYLGPTPDGAASTETTAVDTWNIPPGVGGCPTAARPLPSGLLTDSLGTVGPLTENYTVKAYRYDKTTQYGWLLAEGNVKDSTNNDQAVSRIKLKIKVRTKPKPDGFPGLYGSNVVDMGNNDVLKVVGQTGKTANAICRDCTVSNTSATYCQNGLPTTDGLRQAVNANSNSVIDGSIYIGDPKLPPILTPPANTTCSSTGSECQINLGTNLDLSTTPTLPRSQDVANHKTGTPYHYVVTNVPLGNQVLNISTTGDPVRLYVDGNITLNGQGGILHTGDAARFSIFGHAADTNSSNDQRFTLSGGSQSTNIFVYAPDAIMGINGGSNDPDLQGAIWVKEWGLSSSNRAEIRVPDNMPQLLAQYYGTYFDGVGYQVNASTSGDWTRMEAK